jgi:hypothetical protein
MSETTTNENGLETFCSGDPFQYAMAGLDEISGHRKHSADSMATAIEHVYTTELSEDTAKLLDRFNSTANPTKLVAAVKSVGLNEVDDWDSKFNEDDLQEEVDDVEDPGLSEAMRLIDTRIGSGLCPRDTDAAKITSKNNREHVYVPDLINSAEGGTVYMAKTLSSPAKVRMAWDINDSNQVVVVDEYEKWEKLLGWEKLKQFPHGKNKIREEYGDVLSDEVLEIVAGEQQVNDDDTQDDSDSASRGRRTRTKPSEEVLNLARGSRHKKRRKMQSKDIADTFDDDETIGYHDISMLVLFPSTCDLNMTDHWWIPGDRWPGGGSVAIANCNKGTFEYLNQYEQVWHVEDYLEQATDYEFETNAGPLTMNVASCENLVIHIVSDDNQTRLMRDKIIGNIPEALTEFVEKKMSSHRAPDMPHHEDMVYAPITQEDAFWMRPELRKQQRPNEGDAVVCYADVSMRDLGNTYGISSNYRLYSRARLPDWDFESIEMEQLDRADYYFELDDGGYEVLETLGKLHDRGEQPFSKTPKARWS